MFTQMTRVKSEIKSSMRMVRYVARPLIFSSVFVTAISATSTGTVMNKVGTKARLGGPSLSLDFFDCGIFYVDPEL